MTDDSNSWRKITDDKEDEEVEITKEAAKLIGRLLEGKAPHADFDPHPPYVDWLCYDDAKHPISNAPEPKRRFILSKPERKMCIDAACDPHGDFPALLPNLKTLELTTTTDAFSMNVLIRILRCSPNLESLHLIMQKAIFLAHDPKGDFPASLPNLNVLELTTTIDTFTMNVIICILKRSPNLESLRLSIQEEYLRTKYWEFDEAKTRRILTRHLKRVEFLDFNGEKRRLDIARLLLEHGNALEEMVFSWCDKVKYHEKSRETMHEVSNFYKASSSVKIITLLNK